MDGLIGLTGVTGNVGGRVAALCAARGLPLRLIVRDRGRAPELPGAEVRAAADYGAGEEMRSALDGVETFFLVPGREHADRVRQHLTAVDAAVAAGVRRIVYLSFLGATPDSTFTLARQHWATEEHIRAHGTGAFAFLRMNLYMDFIPSMVSAEGVIAGPAGDGSYGAVMRSDVAASAAAVLAAPGEHDGQTYDLTGPETFSLGQAAALMTELTGKAVTYRNETEDQAYASRAVYGAPDWEVEGWVTSYQAIAAGDFDVVSDDVRRLTGRAPISLREYVSGEPECLAHVEAG